MKYNRRNFLTSAGAATAAALLAGAPGCETKNSNAGASSPGDSGEASPAKLDSWEGVRSQFELDPRYIHMAGLLLASHPAPVANAIERYRDRLNANPAAHVNEKFIPLNSEVRRAAAQFMNADADQIALTDSTTMGTALAITGLHIREDQEMLTAEYDYYSTHESMRYQARRSGAAIRKISLYKNIHEVTEDEVFESLTGNIRDNTRLVTATWVHSSSGLKMPVRRIADRIGEINAGRDPEDRVVFFVDGVHGFGVETTPAADLGCDLFAAGTHKWLFGPRGTGILWGSPRIHDQVSPTIPTFSFDGGWGPRMSPGGFKAFEHEWALIEAFGFQRDIGKERIRDRVHRLARQLKEGLKSMDHVTLYTPLEESLSSGIVCFDMEGMNQKQAVDALGAQNIIASDTPYSPSYARLTPGVYNTEEEIEQVLRVVRDLS